MRATFAVPTLSGEPFLNTRLLQFGRYHYEKFHDDNIKTLLSDPFFTRRKILVRADGFVLLGELIVNFPSISELVCPKKRVGLRLNRARHIFYRIANNAIFVSGKVGSSLYTRSNALKTIYHKK